jgi:release factor glutamine methyltransferase
VSVTASGPPQTWTIDAVVRWATDDFRARGIDKPRLDAEVLLAHALGTTRMQLVIDAKKPLAPGELARFREMVKRRRTHEPVAYLLGAREFYGRSFKVDRRVLIPRPDTETLVDVALARTEGVSLSMRALDLCTGSGCVAITLARQRPTSRVHATDVSDGALEVARENALRLGAYNVSFGRGDLYEAAPPGARFDVITANPPYIASAEVETLQADIKDFEPRLALDGGADGLTIAARVIAGAPAWLAPGGVLAIEIGQGEAPDVVARFEASGFTDVTVTRDLARIERVVSGRRE